MDSKTDFLTDKGRKCYRAALLALEALEEFNDAEGGSAPAYQTSDEAIEVAGLFSQGAATCALAANRILSHLPKHVKAEAVTP